MYSGDIRPDKMLFLTAPSENVHFQGRYPIQTEGSPAQLTVEAAIIVPLIFLLWMLLIAVLFHLFAQVLCAVALDRMSSQYLSFSSYSSSLTEDALREGILQFLSSCGLTLSLNDCQVIDQSSLLYHQYQVHLSFTHLLWNTSVISLSRKITVLPGATFRNRVDFFLDLGEGLPILGEALQRYRDLLLQWRQALHNSRSP